MLTYNECRLLMESARNPSNGKPLANNTRLFTKTLVRGEHTEPYYCVRFHSTDIVEIYANGTYGVRHNGYQTLTTRSRIFDYSPLTWRHLNGKIETSRTCADTWYLRSRPVAHDPEPQHRSIEVDRPQPAPARPGREPQPADFGSCIAERRETYEFQKDEYLTYVHDGEAVADALQTGHALRHGPVTHFTVLLGHQVVKRTAGVAEIRYGAEPYNMDWRDPATYRQCPHCKTYQRAHRAWSARNAAWTYYTSNVERYGSEDAWRAAWRDDRRVVIARNRAWKTWDERNRVELDGLVVVNAQGYPLWREYRAHRRSLWRIKRSEIRQRRAAEELARQARALERFTRSMQRRRRPGFIELAGNVAEELAGIRLRLTATNELES